MQLRPSRDPSLAMTEHTPQALGSTTLEQGSSGFSPGAMGQAHLGEAAEQVAGSRLPIDHSTIMTAVNPRMIRILKQEYAQPSRPLSTDEAPLIPPATA